MQQEKAYLYQFQPSWKIWVSSKNWFEVPMRFGKRVMGTPRLYSEQMCVLSLLWHIFKCSLKWECVLKSAITLSTVVLWIFVVRHDMAPIFGFVRKILDQIDLLSS